MRVPDTNVLLAARDASAPAHETARAWLERALQGHESVGFAWVVLLGFVRIATNPRVYAQPLQPSDALDQVDEWLAVPAAQALHPGPEHAVVLRELLAERGTAGNLTTDAHIAALAIENGATLTSFDGDFHSFQCLKLEHLR